MAAFHPAGNDDRERVRDASDIVRVIGEHMTLKPKGREFVGLCPFHDDHSPSMSVVPSKQIFHCFVCGTGGDVFTFVQKFHKMDFPEAIRYLAERAGIELTRRSPAASPEHGGDDEPGSYSTQRQLYQATALANDFFRTILRHPEHGQAAREVIARRGISDAMVEQFQIGASPDRWDGLVMTAQHNHLPLVHLARAGLFKERGARGGEGGGGGPGDGAGSGSGGGYYDALRHRLIFPIHDVTGRIVGFGGRRLRDTDDPKYLNSPETPIFQKSSTLYGLFQASRSIRKDRLVVVTEGYTDTIACHQAGLTNVVATLGTALTHQHAHVLQRHCETIVLLFDGDQAGEKAAERAVEVLLAFPTDVRIATLAGVTDAKDPDELLKREGGAEVLRQAFAQAKPLLAYRYDRLRAKLKGPALTKAFEEELDTLTRLGYSKLPPEKRRPLLRQLATTWGLSEGIIADRLKSKASTAGMRAGVTTTPSRGTGENSAPLSAEAIVVGCVLADEALWGDLPSQERLALTSIAASDVEIMPVASRILDMVDEGRPCTLPTLLSMLESERDQQLAMRLEKWVRERCEGDPARMDRLRMDCLAALTRRDGAFEVEPKDAGQGSLAKLEAMKQAIEKLGPNRAKLPRPASM